MDETHRLNLMLEVYVKYRDEPISWPMVMDITPAVTTVEQVMDFAYARINGILDSRSEDHLLLVDERMSHHMVFRDQLQVISILAPDKSSIPWGEVVEDEV